MTDNMAAHIKQVTAALHQQLEQSPVSAGLMSPAVTQAHYICYLQASYLLHSAVENDAFPQLAHLVADIEQRRKTAAIAADLVQLGAAPPQLAGGDVPHSKSTSFWLGAMYVTEGSTLGGMYIMKHLRATLGSHMPFSFLDIYNHQAGTRWKHFLTIFNSYADTINNEGRDEITAGAMYAFEKANRIFSQQ